MRISYIFFQNGNKFKAVAKRLLQKRFSARVNREIRQSQDFKWYVAFLCSCYYRQLHCDGGLRLKSEWTEDFCFDTGLVVRNALYGGLYRACESLPEDSTPEEIIDWGAGQIVALAEPFQLNITAKQKALNQLDHNLLTITAEQQKQDLQFKNGHESPSFDTDPLYDPQDRIDIRRAGQANKRRFRGMIAGGSLMMLGVVVLACSGFCPVLLIPSIIVLIISFAFILYNMYRYDNPVKTLKEVFDAERRYLQASQYDAYKFATRMVAHPYSIRLETATTTLNSEEAARQRARAYRDDNNQKLNADSKLTPLLIQYRVLEEHQDNDGELKVLLVYRSKEGDWKISKSPLPWSTIPKTIKNNTRANWLNGTLLDIERNPSEPLGPINSFLISQGHIPPAQCHEVIARAEMQYNKSVRRRTIAAGYCREQSRACISKPGSFGSMFRRSKKYELVCSLNHENGPRVLQNELSILIANYVGLPTQL